MGPLTIIKKYLGKLGVDEDATGVYAGLVASGPSSALQLAKITSISRTQVYRHLETLQQHGLVSAEQLSYGTLYRALPLENIEGLIADREAETAAIRRALPNMAQALQALAGGSGPTASIRHYYGLAGLKQVNWNLTKAEGTFCVFEAAHLSQHLDQAFSRRFREQCIAKGIHTFDLTNATEISLKEVEPISAKLSELRHIDPAILAINFEMYIYNDVVVLLDYQAGHEMALEIHHPSLKMMMQQLFDAMWAQAEPLEISRR